MLGLTQSKLIEIECPDCRWCDNQWFYTEWNSACTPYSQRRQQHLGLQSDWP